MAFEVERGLKGNFHRSPIRVTVMSSKNENVNDLRLRVSDELIDAIRIQRKLYGYSSDNAAAVRLLEQAAFGVIGSLPAKFADVSDELSRIGARVQP